MRSAVRRWQAIAVLLGRVAIAVALLARTARRRGALVARAGRRGSGAALRSTLRLQRLQSYPAVVRRPGLPRFPRRANPVRLSALLLAALPLNVLASEQWIVAADLWGNTNFQALQLDAQGGWVEGNLDDDPIKGSLTGKHLQFTATGADAQAYHFDGRVEGARMKGRNDQPDTNNRAARASHTFSACACPRRLRRHRNCMPSAPRTIPIPSAGAGTIGQNDDGMFWHEVITEGVAVRVPLSELEHATSVAKTEVHSGRYYDGLTEADGSNRLFKRGTSFWPIAVTIASERARYKFSVETGSKWNTGRRSLLE